MARALQQLCDKVTVESSFSSRSHRMLWARPSIFSRERCGAQISVRMVATRCTAPTATCGPAETCVLPRSWRQTPRPGKDPHRGRVRREVGGTTVTRDSGSGLVTRFDSALRKGLTEGRGSRGSSPQLVRSGTGRLVGHNS